MAQNWHDLLSSLGAVAQAENFGRPAAELASAKSETVVAPLEDMALLRASGGDAVEFLHNLLTNDIKNLPEDGTRFAGLCSAKGRLQASFRVWRDGDDMLLLLSADLLPDILKKLSMYVLRSKVKLTDASQDYRVLGIAGEKAAELLREFLAGPPEPGKLVSCADGKVLSLDGSRYLAILLPENAVTVLPRLASAARLVGTAAWRWLEIAAAQPRVVAATYESFVPQMVNMELPAVSGVSFHKGCYPGQEIVARAQYLGKIKRRLFLAHLENAFPVGTDVFSPETGDQHCGTLASVAPSPNGGYDCLVVAQLSAVESGDLRVGTPEGPRLSLLPMPYPVE